MIVEQFDVSCNVVFSLSTSGIHHMMNSLIFEAAEKRFGERVGVS
jgi:hypothetical protein